MGLKDRIRKIEKENKISKYIPVLFLDSEEHLEEYRHLVGPETVVIIDDIGAVEEC